MPKVVTDAVPKVVYEKISVEVCAVGLPGVPDKILSLELAKKMVGWEEVIDGPYHLTDFNGNKIRLNHSSRNRPFIAALAKSYVSELLHGHWQFNGETIILTRFGECASGQHRLVAFILAWQLFTNEKDKWILHCGEDGPKMPCLVVKGISDEDKVINTIDTGKPRTFEDVLYRSEMFNSVKESERRILVRVLSAAVMLFGDRIRAWDGQLSTRRTHQDYLEMLERHKTLIEMAKFIWESDDDEKKVFKAFGIPPGAVAGMLYLMACSGTEDAANNYHRQDILSEDNLDFGMRDKAEGFITEILDSSLGATLRKAREALYDSEGNDLGVDGRLAIIAKAWNLYAEGKTITAKAITPKVVQLNGQPLVLDKEGKPLSEIPSPDGEKDDDGKVLMEIQLRKLDDTGITVGGIDLAGEQLEDDRLSPTNGDETVIRDVDPPKKPIKQFPKGKPAVVGKECIVRDSEGDWTGKLLYVYDVKQEHIDAEPEWGALATIGEKRAEVQQIKGRKVWDVPYDVCHLLEA